MRSSGVGDAPTTLDRSRVHVCNHSIQIFDRALNCARRDKLHIEADYDGHGDPDGFISALRFMLARDGNNG